MGLREGDARGGSNLFSSRPWFPLSNRRLLLAVARLLPASCPRHPGQAWRGVGRKKPQGVDIAGEKGRFPEGGPEDCRRGCGRPEGAVSW